MRLFMLMVSFGLLTACGGVGDVTSNEAVTLGLSTPGNISAIPSQ